ncbi:MAG: peroxiredoxin [Planctomycetes bacterium]|nr:peroxiredoxin [Planctomycetota bacterium]
MRTLTLLALTASLMMGNRAMAEIKVGDPAPTFTSTSDDGKPWKSADHVGKKIVVVYFYPADFTGGCTKQACAYGEDNKKLSEKGVEVVGVSGDSVMGHQLFKAHHKLPFTLLADEDGSVAKAFGVPFGKGGVSKGIDKDGKTVEIKQGVRIQRWTFVIGKDGKIAHIDNKVAAADDSKKIAEVVEKLSK